MLDVTSPIPSASKRGRAVPYVKPIPTQKTDVTFKNWTLLQPVTGQAWLGDEFFPFL